MLGADLALVLPELLLALYAMAALMVGAFGRQDALSGALCWSTAAVLALLAVIVGFGSGDALAFNGAFVADGFARFAKVVVLSGAAVMLVLSAGYMKRRGMLKFEFPILIALAVLLAGCQVRPLYLDAATGGSLSPVADLRGVAIDPPRDRV
ncbi:MAG: NADH-quinone oxidoreductase subunit N, partial [Pseudomonadota bacterium]